MTNSELILFIIYAKNKNEIIHLLNKYRISVKESKYC